ncbi:MAG: response regulator [Kiritimatiellales bacterium]
MNTLLIVDDDRYLVDSLRVVFSGLYTIHTALSAEEAAEQLNARPVDIMLLDIALPGINGLDFLRQVKHEHPGLPVVMISGTASIRPVMEALDIGAADYVRKPFDIDDLRLITARALRVSDLQRQVETLEQELRRRPWIAEPGEKPLKETLEDVERLLIEKAMTESGGIQTRAAELLGTTRRILRYRIDKLNIQS